MNSQMKGEFTETVRYIWTIKNFFKLFHGKDHCLGNRVSSPYFPTEGTKDIVEKWIVNIRASNKSRLPDSPIVSWDDRFLIIDVRNINPDYSMSASFPDYCKLEMMDEDESCLFSIVVPKKVSFPDCTFNTQCHLNELLRQIPALKTDDALTIIVTLGVDPIPWLQTPKYNQSPLTDQLDKNPLPKFFKYLKQMLDQGDLTDFTIKTKSKNFNCHKVVLAASSQYFRAMLQCKMKEQSENTVDFGDSFDETTMKAVLDFMYTDRAPTDTQDLSYQKLYVAADYFQLSKLKEICAIKLCHSLNVDNAMDILQFAEECNENLLKGQVVKFMEENFSWSKKFWGVVRGVLLLFLQYTNCLISLLSFGRISMESLIFTPVKLFRRKLHGQIA